MDSSQPTNEHSLDVPKDFPSSDFLWMTLAAWAFSFLLPAVVSHEFMENVKPMPGWKAAFNALVLFGSPVAIVEPHALSGLANLFMLFGPVEIKRVKRGTGKTYAVLFLITTILAVSLPYIPPSMDIADIRSFEAGYLVWTLSLIGACSWFVWSVWKKSFAVFIGSALAVTMLFGMFVWFPARAAVHQKERASQDQAAQQRSQDSFQTERDDAASQIAAHGLTAFTQPLTGIQEQVLIKTIETARDISSADLLAASKHYTQHANINVMEAVAGNPKCPAESLDLLYEYAVSQPNPTRRYFGLYAQISKNPNVSPRLLVKMVHSGIPEARSSAAENLSLPRAERMAYLKQGCSFDYPDVYVVARDRDTPVDILECISTKLGAAQGLADNPNTPTSVLEAMSQSNVANIAQEGKRGLATRRGQFR